VKTKLLVFKNGERFPILLGDDGMPLFYPTIYGVTLRRQRNLASSTISVDMAVIKFLYSWASGMRIDLEGRFHKGEFLTLNEIENLTDTFRKRVDYYFDDIPMFSAGTESTNKPLSTNNALKVRSKESFRMTEPKASSITVISKTTARRLYIVSSYLNWLAQQKTTWISMTSPLYEVSKIARAQMKENIDERIPEVNRYETNKREGLSKAQQDLLLEVIKPDSPRNPWHNEFTRLRNQLFVHLLLKLGPRRGEILQVRIQRDINAGTNTLQIRRVPDDKTDRRKDEPNAKTFERDLPLGEELAKLVSDYVTTVRNTVKGARLHDYLLIATHTGRPLSKTAVTKIFSTLRWKIPELPKTFTSHILRHTWNDNFSIDCDESKIPKEDEMKIRNLLVGWKDNSRSAETYTRRTVKAKAKEVSLRMQEKTAKGRKGLNDNTES
jgi:integrase